MSFSFCLGTRYHLKGFLRNKLKAASRIAKKQMLRRIPQASQRPTFSPSVSAQRHWGTTPRRSGGMVNAVLEPYQYFSLRADDPDAMNLKLQVAKGYGRKSELTRLSFSKLCAEAKPPWRPLLEDRSVTEPAGSGCSLPCLQTATSLGSQHCIPWLAASSSSNWTTFS